MKREINMCKFGKESEKVSKIIKKEAKPYKESREDTIIVDPFGSYTGVNINDKYEKPVQDVDDL